MFLEGKCENPPRQSSILTTNVRADFTEIVHVGVAILIIVVVFGRSPPFAKQRVRATLPFCKHGDDMFLIVGMDGFNKARALGGAHPPNLQTK